MTTLAGLAAALLYFSACLALSWQLSRRQPPRVPLILGLGLTALPLHLCQLHAVIHTPNGMDLGIFHMISLMGWLVAALTIGISLYRPVVSLTLGAYPFALSGLLLSQFASAPYTPLQGLSRGMEAHILLSILAYSVLSIAAAQALLLALQDRLLRRHQPALLRSLPPLVTMERMLFDLIAVGFVLLTLAIISGFISLENLLAQHVAHKTLFTLGAWLMFAVLLAGRFWRGWRGKTAIQFTLWGFALLLLGYYGSKVVLELILHRAV